ncbi:major facilitator superfamily domain-containing protein [Leucosporidium creatinivorum]|uniref:Major facilitator superfamily domain-containing protein n=1 Tax=Leucosporidium creatinivorum TaxID=106004 RepID=A0A1Y2EPV7_9BASI|nr:major facilitator superfamily domain-containing protein [Leucosporidium creatinivorum]
MSVQTTKDESPVSLEAQKQAQSTSSDRDPTLAENHPINALSEWRKFFILCTLSYSGFLANFSIAITQVAFPEMGAAFGVSPGMIPNAIGYNLLGIAVGPLFWNPLSKSIGRRPVYLIGSAVFIPCAIWMALSNSYSCFCVARVFAGLSSSWSQTVPPATVADMTVKSKRGDKMSMFGTAVVIAPAVAPLFCGLIINSASWRCLFWLILGLACLQLALFFFIVPETLWVEDEAPFTSTEYYVTTTKVKGEHEHIEAPEPAAPSLGRGHVGALYMPWKDPVEYLRICMSPILMAQFLPITLVSIYYGSVFAWSVGITIVMPQLFEEPPYSFSTIPLGCAFLAFGIGGVLGKWSGGIVGDKTVSYLERKKGHRQPEHRLWALLPILPFMLVACIIVGVTIVHELHWIAYLIGGGLFFFAFSASTGLLQTYVLETYVSRSMDTQAVFVFFKSIWGFAIPFFVTSWGSEADYLSEYAAQGALATGVGFLLAGGLIWKGYELRKWQGMPVTPRADG